MGHVSVSDKEAESGEILALLDLNVLISEDQ